MSNLYNQGETEHSRLSL